MENFEVSGGSTKKEKEKREKFSDKQKIKKLALFRRLTKRT